MFYIYRIIGLIKYLFIFIYELVMANIQVAKLILKPGLNFKSAAIRYKSAMKTKTELILLTNSITFTPGTLVMDASLETGEVLVHMMTGESIEQMKNELLRFPEKAVMEALRIPGQKEENTHA